MDKSDIKNFTVKELEGMMIKNGYPRFRGVQIFKWIYKDVASFKDMKNLPGDIIEFLEENFYIGRAILIDKQQSKDGTIKYLLGLHDKNAVECVLMEYKHGYSICISSQVGCRMQCSFCASTEGGLVRSLSAGEMVEEVMAAARERKIVISNIVIMGIGEPFDNYDELMKFLNIINSKDGINIGMRHITISTSGLVPRIYGFADENLQCTLAVSLHSAIDEVRSMLMPINRKYNISELIKACDYYISKTNRRITFEYALIKDVNDGANDADALVKLLRGKLCHINLIPINPVSGKAHIRSGHERVEEFKKIIEDNGLQVTLRRELGTDIQGACGQLRKNYIAR
ncbi:23S rRNA (adenine(2503)-C(2))-methyltransferase RlmN [Lutispora saccharofermentans]|uniref:Probable dual-specificity RNA methyltransferase RlmN n=1 Tax=Lutispora saccharofermentans TaxID=3024236 RepID=A0ABT1N9X7_9FIRM|nr:23S rRNA (adenine(2503)-C(2))-methyltransferase RlmN [Lutispora saccharofermentans]MCQ1528060.1 23S rRNA (adenine(2503)-C(2))-methyltransferase RlmN [Lutispora saccharofermentans]